MEWTYEAERAYAELEWETLEGEEDYKVEEIVSARCESLAALQDAGKVTSEHVRAVHESRHAPKV